MLDYKSRLLYNSYITEINNLIFIGLEKREAVKTVLKKCDDDKCKTHIIYHYDYEEE